MGGLSIDDSENYRQLTVADALSYLDAVKERFKDNYEVYNSFLDTMKDFKRQRCVICDSFRGPIAYSIVSLQYRYVRGY